MNCITRRFEFSVIAFAALASIALFGCGDSNKDTQAESLVKRIADDLDKRTTSSGVYIRAKDGEIKETDPWGTPIDVSYSQGGIAEIVHVRSAGPDHQLHTADDVVAERMSANLKGVGEGVKKNVEETAQRAAKGVVKGAVQGVKEAIQESLPQRKKGDKADTPPPNNPATEK